MRVGCRGEVLEHDLVLGRPGLAIDPVELGQGDVALAIHRGADLALDGSPVRRLNRRTWDGERRCRRCWREVRRGKTETVGQHFQSAIADGVAIFGLFLEEAKSSSCLRIRLAFSMPASAAISSNWLTWS